MPDPRPIPPPPSKQTHSSSPTDARPRSQRQPGLGGIPKQYAEGSHAAGDLQKGHVLPGQDGGPDRIVHSVTQDKDRVRVATQSGNGLPVVETFPGTFRFSPKS